MSCNCREIDEYIAFVRSGVVKQCKEQYLLCDLIERIFQNEELFIDKEQLKQYLSYEKYFPYKLLPWERFCFTLHNCVYQQDGQLRFPNLFILVGRGAGKNGYLAFEDFCLLTKTNGVQKYDIYTFAMSEAQAKTSWQDVYDVLETHRPKMIKHFRWTKEVIFCKDTNSSYYYCTASPKTKDGARPGKINVDEEHQFEHYKLLDVAKTGLGKKEFPRMTETSTDGLVRGGPLDDSKALMMDILEGNIPDNGLIPFICRLDSKEEVDDESCWYKANPSLYVFGTLLQQLKMEYVQYKANPAANVSFIAKRMNLPPEELENAVTSWDNILATNKPVDEKAIYGMPCVGGIDYMKTTDFLGAGLLWRVGDIDYWICHTWICSHSADLSRVKAPLREWEAKGLVTFVEASEISPELPATWLAIQAAKRNSKIMKIGIDSYRYQLLSNALQKMNFSADKGYENVIKLRPSDEMMNIPLITSGFVNQKFCWGDEPMMRWACNNSKTITSPAGNITYGKIEPKSRKTDTFKAFVAAECVSKILDKFKDGKKSRPKGVFKY